MVKRALIGVLVLLLLAAGTAGAEIEWNAETPAQLWLQTYIDHVNTYLTKAGEQPVNRLFEMYPGFAVLGITGEADAETPEDVEITVTMSHDLLTKIQVRVSDVSRFPAIAGGMINALYGQNMTFDEACDIPAKRAERAKAEPANSFEEPVEEMNGTIPRFYYAYYPNQYRDGVNWIQLTIVMPMDSSWDGNGMVIGEENIRGVDAESGVSEDYEGYYSEDDYSHFEVFSTATPEPDSAAAEYDFR